MTNGAITLIIIKPGERIRVRYRNWRGEIAIRRLELQSVAFWGTTQWHPEPQWLVAASDLDRPGESRIFALQDMEPVDAE